MSHYLHNINSPHFPPGVHMSHFSLTNTTLTGQEVQQRLWEKYWGQQYPVPPVPYKWPPPGMYYHGYPYGIPNIFHPGSIPGGFDQSHHTLRRQFGEIIDSANQGRRVEPCLESYCGGGDRGRKQLDGKQRAEDSETTKGCQIFISRGKYYNAPVCQTVC